MSAESLDTGASGSEWASTILPKVPLARRAAQVSLGSLGGKLLCRV